MNCALSLILLAFVLLQLTIRIDSMISPVQSADNEANRPHMPRRLRPPMMGRSLLSVLSSNGDADMTNNESSGSSTSDEDQMFYLNKRRQGVPLFGRRWIPTKRRGPLFG